MIPLSTNKSCPHPNGGEGLEAAATLSTESQWNAFALAADTPRRCFLHQRLLLVVRW